MKITPIALFAATILAGCGNPDSDREESSAAVAEGRAASAADSGVSSVECALQGSKDFQPACTVERIRGDRGETLVLRAPEGGFRRLLVTSDGRGVVAADGAEPAEVTPTGRDRIEIRIGGDIYRLPATVREPVPPPDTN